MTKNEMQNMLELAGYEFLVDPAFVKPKYVAYPPMGAHDFFRAPCTIENNRGRCLKKTWEHYELCR